MTRKLIKTWQQRLGALNPWHGLDPIEQVQLAPLMRARDQETTDLRARVMELEAELSIGKADAAEWARANGLNVPKEWESVLAARQPVVSANASTVEAESVEALDVIAKMAELHQCGVTLNAIRKIRAYLAAPPPSTVKGEVTDEYKAFTAWVRSPESPVPQHIPITAPRVLEVWAGWESRALLSQQGTKGGEG